VQEKRGEEGGREIYLYVLLLSVSCFLVAVEWREGGEKGSSFFGGV